VPESDSKTLNRRSIRLQGYDYSQVGGYFVTICAIGRRRIFGDVKNGEIGLSEFGEIVQSAWDDLPNHYPGLELDAFVVMPNHVHGIIVICGVYVVGAGLKPAPTDMAPDLLSIDELWNFWELNNAQKRPPCKRAIHRPDEEALPR
jgi:hypothetical protein